MKRLPLCALSAALLFSGTLQARTRQDEPDLTELSVEDLLALPVTSVAKKKQPWRESAAAIHVITAEDLRRSGATTIPEALRWVPGMQVAQIDASKWAVTARGFNGQFANKLLVLVDGRSVYTPLFSGVFWEMQDTPLEDVERIEVIRGPGAALWGANAVNGVVNIITRDARDTQGSLLTLGTGNEEQGFATFRHGGKLGEDGHYRVFAKGFVRDGTVEPSGSSAEDGWSGGRAGFRVDRRRAQDHLTLSGELFDLEIGRAGTGVSFEPPFERPLSEDVDGSGGHLLARWTHTASASSERTFQLYVDRAHYVSDIFADRRDTVDFDYQERRATGGSHDLIWGLGYRFLSDDQGAQFSEFVPEREDSQVFSAFLQDEVRGFGDRLRVTLGTKLEHNHYTGFEVQPSLRALWTAGPRQTFWASVSRAVRTPSRAENTARITVDIVRQATGLPAFFTALGNPEVGSERLTAYELGYRCQPAKSVHFDLASFYNDYEDVIGLTPGMPYPVLTEIPPHLVVPLNVGNGLAGRTSGFELSFVWEAAEEWRLSGTYTYLDMSLTANGATRAVSGAGDVPSHQATLLSSLDFVRRGEWELMTQYVDELPGLGVASYFRVDSRWAWHASDSIELSLVVRNALDRRHAEFVSMVAGTLVRTEIGRSVYGKLSWSF